MSQVQTPFLIMYKFEEEGKETQYRTEFKSCGALDLINAMGMLIDICKQHSSEIDQVWLSRFMEEIIARPPQGKIDEIKRT